jgi:SAM-dependent methyltransferase
VSNTPFTGERLHEDRGGFGLDLARHRVAYKVAQGHATDGWVLDLGCGSGYGTAALSHAAAHVVGLDRVAPDSKQRGSAGHFVRANLEGIPFAKRSFALVVSFQVIEHLEDPGFYVATIAELLRPDGVALITTPNRLTSDGVNPYHVHEYVSDELAACLAAGFESVEMRGVNTSERVREVLAARSRRIRRIMRLDPLGLRNRLPRGLIEWLFARFADMVRNPEPAPDTESFGSRDFPVGEAGDDCLDLLAICRRPR